jgi:hypothetical protein
MRAEAVLGGVHRRSEGGQGAARNRSARPPTRRSQPRTVPPGTPSRLAIPR